VNNEFENKWKGAVVAYLRHYSAERLEVIRTAKKKRRPVQLGCRQRLQNIQGYS